MSIAAPTARTDHFAATLTAGALLIALGAAAYGGALGGPLVFDDVSAVLGNGSLHQLWPPGGVLHPPPDSTVAGRPLLNLTFALNYALGGPNPVGYHIFNLVIHLLAGLVLFGLARRTLLRPALPETLGKAAVPLAFAIAASWLLHPIQTASVTYVSQRAESLMGLFYLLGLYAFVRRDGSTHPGRWDLVTIAAGALGAATKEVMMTMPVAILLYDRTFVAGSFREAWRRHARLYLGLTVVWLILGGQLLGLRDHGAGFGLGQSAGRYFLTECEVVLRYLGLAFWPHPLVFDYGEEMARPGSATPVFVFMLAACLIITLVALWRRPVIGFLAGWFFLVLSPTSSFVPIVHQPMAENRLYLPLATVVAGVLTGVFILIGRKAFLAVAAALVVGLIGLTMQRNADFDDEIGLWQDTVTKRPDNARAHYNLGYALAAAGRTAEAARAYQTALRLKPSYAEAHQNLGNALARLGRRDEAVPHYEEALRIKPDYANAHYNLASTLVELGRLPEAVAHFEAALQLEPEAAGIHYNLGSALARLGRGPEAIGQFAEAVRLRPGYPEALTNWGNLLGESGRWPEAINRYEAALKSAPNYAEAHINLGNALFAQHRVNEAVEHYEAALRLNPRSAAAHYNVGNLELARGQLPEAISHFETAVRLDPALAGAHHNLALALNRIGRVAEAVPHYEETLRLVPNSAVAHHNLAVALGELGRVADAIVHDEAALRIQPDYAAARDHLAWLRFH